MIQREDALSGEGGDVMGLSMGRRDEPSEAQHRALAGRAST
jgi:hypothetical protein